MSSLFYIAADIPLPEIVNPHEQTISIAEALVHGIEVPDFLLQDKNIDRNDPNMLLVIDSLHIDAENGIWEDCAYEDDFSICPMEKQEDILTEKKYCASLQWNGYTKGRAKQVIRYIQKLLSQTPQVEIWHIWRGASYPPPRIRKVRILADELDEDALERLAAFEVWQTDRVVSQEIPREWGIQEDELEICDQYCCEIVRG